MRNDYGNQWFMNVLPALSCLWFFARQLASCLGFCQATAKSCQATHILPGKVGGLPGKMAVFCQATDFCQAYWDFAWHFFLPRV